MLEWREQGVVLWLDVEVAVDTEGGEGRRSEEGDEGGENGWITVMVVGVAVIAITSDDVQMSEMREQAAVLICQEDDGRGWG